MVSLSSCRRVSLSVLVVLACGSSSIGQKFEPNYDESQVPKHELPPILDEFTLSADDRQEAWQARRAELLEVFAAQMYGTQPTLPFELECEHLESGTSHHGKAQRDQYRVHLRTDAGEQSIDLLVYTPRAATAPVPTFLGLSFYGNHTVAMDPEITITKSWCRSSSDKGVVDNRATEAGRGSSSNRWPVETIVEAGYGLATAYCGDIDPDFDDGFKNGVHALFPEHRPGPENPDRWGTISAWAWGLSRLLDCLQTSVAQVDGQRVVVIGHSRLGKTSLWAGATDSRFAAAISNDSGCGGAALSRRAYGETVERINTSFPHWFCHHFRQYNQNEAALPIDQHQLLALMAPRPLYVASASDDQWADPRGEFLATRLAGQAYVELGLPGLRLDELPAPNTASVGHVSYHLREGKHDINAWDWENYLKFISQLK